MSVWILEDIGTWDKYSMCIYTVTAKGTVHLLCIAHMVTEFPTVAALHVGYTYS